MAPDKLTPSDSRVEHRKASIRGKTYHYLLGQPPNGNPSGTILLLHGFPDLAFAWRYQVPLLLSLGLQVIVPDIVGYGQTDSPDDLAAFSFKSVSDDLAELVRLHVDHTEQILLGGHDWGGTLAWRLTLWHPSLVRAVFSVCVPFTPPSPKYLSTEAMVSRLPNFTYQLQLQGPAAEREIVGEPKLRLFLNGMFGGQGPNGEGAFSEKEGVLFENLPKLGPSPLINDAELDYYVTEYARNGMRGPLNWYRTRKINYEEEMALVDEGRVRIAVPALLIMAEKDSALPPSMAEGVERHFDNLSKKLVDAHHWALVEVPEDVNRLIKEFLLSVIESRDSKASL